MTGDLEYTQEQFDNAIRALALNEGALSERVRLAVSELAMAGKPGAGIPMSEPLQQTVESFLARARATGRSDVEIAKALLDVSYEINHEYYQRLY